MRPHNLSLTKGALWATAAFGIAQVMRFATNVVLTRLLAPELFGIMVIVNAFRTGIELISDVGIGQSIIQNGNADDPNFYNTAWTIKSLRGIFLWLIGCAAAVPVAHFYKTPSLVYIIPIASFVFVLSGFTPVSQFLVQKKMLVAKLSMFQLGNLFIWTCGQLALAYFIPTIWALVFGLLLGSTIVLISSFFLLPGLSYKFTISALYARQILHFGKWIFVSSIIFFLSMSFDRLYFARIIPLALLGVYGISQTISGLLTTLVSRLANVIVFPYISSRSDLQRADLRAQLISVRLKFLLIAALGFSVSASIIDLAVKFVFDQRYQAAAWMVPILILGAWISILCTINESTLLGLGQPRYATIGSASKFGWLLVSLPLSFNHLGFVGCIVVIAVSDVFRYVAAFFGQWRERFSFGKQDLLITALMLVLFGIFEWLRWTLGLGTSFESLPHFSWPI